MWYKVWALIALNILFFGRTLAYGMIIDDIAAFNEQDKLRTENFWTNLWLQFKQAYSESPALGHLFNIVVHTLNTVLVYFLFGQTDIAFLTAVLFCINPVGNMASTWLSGRTYAVATTLILLGFTFPLLFFVVYPITFAWSISTILAPLLFVFGEYKVLILLLPVVAYFARRRYLDTIKLRINTVSPVMKKFEFRKIILVFKTFAYYFILCMFPFKLGMCHTYLHTFGLSDKETEPWFKLDKFFFLGIILMALIALCVVNMGVSFSFGLIWFFIFSIQWCNWIVINHPITERYMYLANIGLMYFMASLIINTPLMWVFLTMYAVLNIKYIPVYRSCLEYWRSNVTNFPEVAIGYNQYGLELKAVGQVGTAFDVWLQGRKIRPQDFKINYNISNLLAEQGRWDIIKEFVVATEENICKISNYEFWSTKVKELKAIVSAHGVNFDLTKEQEEAIKKDKELRIAIDKKEVDDLNSMVVNPFLHEKFRPEYVEFLQHKYKVKLEGVQNVNDVQPATGGSEAKSDTGAGGNTV